MEAFELQPAGVDLDLEVLEVALQRFPLLAGGTPSETAASLGTGFLFKDGMGGIDASLERVSRSEGSAFTEKAWLLSITASLRPNRRSR